MKSDSGRNLLPNVFFKSSYSIEALVVWIRACCQRIYMKLNPPLGASAFFSLCQAYAWSFSITRQFLWGSDSPGSCLWARLLLRRIWSINWHEKDRMDIQRHQPLWGCSECFFQSLIQNFFSWSVFGIILLNLRRLQVHGRKQSIETWVGVSGCE